MSHFQKEYFFKPSGIVSYSTGSFGGVRATVHLQAFLCELGTPSISSILPIPKIRTAFDEDGNALDDAYERRSQKFLDEFEWYSKALKEARKNGTPY